MNHSENAKQYFQIKIGDYSDSRAQLFNDMVTFMESIDIQDYDRADDAMQRIIKDSRGGLYNEVGKVTRKLHDAIKNFKVVIDPKIMEMATSDMPNAVDKLQFVITKTEEAANTTMEIVEKYMESMGELDSHIGQVVGTKETINYFDRFRAELEEDMTTVLMAQSFQDLTGQNIRKVIALVSEIESELVKLITSFGDIKPEPQAQVVEQPKPAPEVITGQSDVDDLLSQFGF